MSATNDTHCADHNRPAATCDRCPDEPIWRGTVREARQQLGMRMLAGQGARVEGVIVHAERHPRGLAVAGRVEALHRESVAISGDVERVFSMIVARDAGGDVVLTNDDKIAVFGPLPEAE